jgi:hypothetical protein
MGLENENGGMIILMKRIINIFIMVLLSAIQSYASNDLEFTLSVSPLEWKVPVDNKYLKILLEWKVKNSTDHPIILPIPGLQLTLIDARGNLVAERLFGSDHGRRVSDQDFRKINPGHIVNVSTDRLSVYYDNIKSGFFLEVEDMRGMTMIYGPLKPSRYKLVGRIAPDTELSEYAHKAFPRSAIWLGEFTSPWITIDVKESFNDWLWIHWGIGDSRAEFVHAFQYFGTIICLLILLLMLIILRNIQNKKLSHTSSHAYTENHR